VTAPTKRRPDESMTLLVEVMERPLDPGYAEAARRRAAGEGDRRGAGFVLLALVAVLLGLMTVTAAQQLRAPAEGVSARTLLETQIEDRQAEVDALRAESAALSEEVAALQERALRAGDSELVEQVRLDAVVTGAVPVSGPGLVVTMSDATEVAEGVAPSDVRVQATDLQTVVNALWASGAEAISVGGQRLTSLSAIRHAGAAIMVDLVPLPGPSYEVAAIGDPEQMQTEYARTGVPADVRLLADLWGIETTMETADELVLPSVGNQLRYAEPAEGDEENVSQEENP